MTTLPFYLILFFVHSAFGSNWLNECNRPLGLQDGRVLDSQLSAPYFYEYLYIGNGNSVHTKPEYARLNNSCAWCAPGGRNYYIEVDFNQSKIISGIATQGFTGVNDYYVKEYRVVHSRDGVEWHTRKKVWIGNSDAQTIVKNTFTMPISARYIRVYPVSYKYNICIRMELYGCTNLTTVATTTPTVPTAPDKQSTSTSSEAMVTSQHSAEKDNPNHSPSRTTSKTTTQASSRTTVKPTTHTSGRTSFKASTTQASGRTTVKATTHTLGRTSFEAGTTQASSRTTVKATTHTSGRTSFKASTTQASGRTTVKATTHTSGRTSFKAGTTQASAGRTTVKATTHTSGRTSFKASTTQASAGRTTVKATTHGSSSVSITLVIGLSIAAAFLLIVMVPLVMFLVFFCHQRHKRCFSEYQAGSDIRYGIPLTTAVVDMDLCNQEITTTEKYNTDGINLLSPYAV